MSLPDTTTTYRRVEFIRRILAQGATLIVDSEAYYHGPEGLPSLEGEIYIYFHGPQQILAKPFIDENADATLRTRLRRVWPPLEPIQLHHA